MQDMWMGKGNWYEYLSEDIKDVEKAYCYLPPETEEPHDAYINRLKRSRYERRFRNAIEKDFAGLLSQFIVKEAPRSLLQNQDNVDLRGNSLRLFLKEADKLALRDKYCFILVEYPPQDESIQSEADRLQSGRRPYFVLLDRASVINWEVEYRNGREVLTKLVFRKTEYRPVGQYGNEEVEFYYVLVPGAYAAYEMVENGGTTIAKIASDRDGNGIAGTTSLDYIPVAIHSLTDTNVLENDLSFPLQDLAEMNLELYQIESEKREILHKCNMPSLVVDRRNKDGYVDTGGEDQDQAIVIGTNSVNYDVDMKWVEPTGKAIEATQNDIKLLNQRIDTQTLAFLSGSNVARTATEADINSTQSRSNFANLAVAKESSFNSLAKIWADYESEPDGNWQIECDRNLFKSPLDLSVSEVQDLYLTGVISINLCLTVLKAKKIFGDSFTEEDLEQELARTRTLSLNERDEDEVIAG